METGRWRGFILSISSAVRTLSYVPFSTDKSFSAEQGIAVAAGSLSQADTQNLGTIVVDAFRAKLLRPRKHRSPMIAKGDDFEDLVKASERN